MDKQHTREARIAWDLYVILCGVVLVILGLIQSSPAVEIFEDGSGIVYVQDVRVRSFCLPLAICHD